MNVKSWMAWEGGVDLVAATGKGLASPNVIVHLARVVHTPLGSAPSGLVLWQPDPGAAPAVMGFVSHDPRLAAWFGPAIFAGTPFQEAPALAATITVEVSSDRASSRLEVAGHVLEVVLERLGKPTLVDRPPTAMPPFHQQGIEAAAAAATLRVDGREVPLVLPPVGVSGGPAAVFSAAGIYAR